MSRQLALEFLLAQKWAIEPSVLALMGDIASRKFSMAELDNLLPAQALEGQGGRPVTAGLQKRGAVAVIGVSGVISRYSSMFHAMCGGCSAQAIATDFQLAINDPQVRSIAMNFDTPGGDVNGIHELGEMIYNARGIKPIVAYVGGSAASAGYWLATACDEVVMDATASVGSIGVIMTVQRSKDDQQLETLQLVSSQSPNKCLSPFEEKGAKAYQRQIDQLAEVFVERTARNLGTDTETVLKEFGGGAVLIGQAAVEKGMAARLGSLEGVIAELQDGKNTSMKENETKAATNAPTVAAFVLPIASALSATDMIAALTADRPDVLAALKGPEPVTALAAAEEIAAACMTAGMPEMSARLLTTGVTKEAALKQINTAQSLKDTLQAAGIPGSFSAISAEMGDPVAMVGKAIHEAQASADESTDSTPHIVHQQTKTHAALDQKSIYSKRSKTTK